MDLIGNFVSLGAILCGLLLFMLVPAFFLSIPGWLTGRIAAPNSPRLTTVRPSKRYWTAWIVLGGIPLTVSVVGGPLAGSNHLVPTALAVALAVIALIALNVSAFFLGYKQGLAAKAKKEVRESLKSGLAFSSAPATGSADLLHENHPAIAPDRATTPLPVVDADRSPDRDAPTQETTVPDTVPSDDEYPEARPHGE